MTTHTDRLGALELRLQALELRARRLSSALTWVLEYMQTDDPEYGRQCLAEARNELAWDLV